MAKVEIKINQSKNEPSARSKKSRVLKQVRDGKMSVKKALLEQKYDVELNKVLTVDEVEAAGRGEHTVHSARNVVIVEIDEEDLIDDDVESEDGVEDENWDDEEDGTEDTTD